MLSSLKPGLAALKSMPGKLSTGNIFNLALIGLPLLISSFDKTSTPEEKLRQNTVDIAVGLTSLRFKGGLAQLGYSMYLGLGMTRGIGKGVATSYQQYISQSSLTKIPFAHSNVGMIRADYALKNAAAKLGAAYGGNMAFQASQYLNNR